MFVALYEAIVILILKGHCYYSDMYSIEVELAMLVCLRSQIGCLSSTPNLLQLVYRFILIISYVIIDYKLCY